MIRTGYVEDHHADDDDDDDDDVEDDDQDGASDNAPPMVWRAETVMWTAAVFPTSLAILHSAIPVRLRLGRVSRIRCARWPARLIAQC